MGSFSNGIVIPYGEHKGVIIEEPRRFDMINHKEDREHASVVFMAMLALGYSHRQNKEAGRYIQLIEVDDRTSDGCGWVLTGFGLTEEPTTADIAKVKNACNGEVLISTYWANDKLSHNFYRGSQLFGAIVAVIKSFEPPAPVYVPPITKPSFKYEQALKHRNSAPSFKQSSSSSSSLSKLPPRSKKDLIQSAIKNHHSDESRFEKVRTARRTAFENRSWFDKFVDYFIFQISEEDIKASSPSHPPTDESSFHSSSAPY